MSDTNTTNPITDDDELLQTLLDNARQHGEDSDFEDGATHEVGDLQELVERLWEMLDPYERYEVVQGFVNEEHPLTTEGGRYTEICEYLAEQGDQ